MRGQPDQDRVLQYVRDYWPEDQSLWKFLVNSLSAGGYSMENMLVDVPDTEIMRCMYDYFILSKRFG